MGCCNLANPVKHRKFTFWSIMCILFLLSQECSARAQRLKRNSRSWGNRVMPANYQNYWKPAQTILEKDLDICVNNEDLCDHLCIAEIDFPYYSCACFEGYGFHPDDPREKRECMRRCDYMSYWDPEEYVCKPVKKECRLDSILADINIKSPYIKSRYPNLGDIGRGYDLMIADPYNARQRDPGIKARIFSPYSTNPESELCEVQGYEISQGATSVSHDYIETFTSLEQLTESFKEVAKEVDYFETSDIQVQDLDNRRISKNLNRGITDQETRGGSRNDGQSNTKTDSFTFSFGNSGERSNTGTSDENTENCLTKGNTLSIGQTLQSSSSQGGSTDQGSSEENCNTKGTSYSKENRISAQASVGWGPFSASVETSSASTVGGSEENRKCQTSNTNVNSNWQAGRTQTGESSQQSNTQTNTCGRAGYTNQKALRMMNDMRKQADRSQAQGQTSNLEMNYSDMRQASIQHSSDEQLELGETKHYTIGGFKDGFTGSKTLELDKQFIKEYQGSVAVTQKKYTQYTASIKNHIKPAFTLDFILEIQKLDDFTFTWGEFDSTSNMVSKRLDDFFVEFIKTYGTHFPKSVNMGSRWFATSRFTEEETTSTQKSDLEQCLIKYNNKKQLNQETEKCVSPNGVERLVVSGHSIKRVEAKVLGDTRPDVALISDFQTENPVPVSMELEPIIGLFNSKYMNRDQITTKEGYQIDYKAILGWFLPRYLNLCNFTSQINPGNLALQEYCQAQVFCNPRHHSCDLDFEVCIPDSSKVQGYRCEAKTKCPLQGCPVDKIVFYGTDNSRNEYCWVSPNCDKATSVDGKPGSGSNCLPSEGYGQKYCCMDKGTSMPACESVDPICPQQPDGCKRKNLRIIGFEQGQPRCMPYYLCDYVTSMRGGAGSGSICTGNPGMMVSFKYCCTNPSFGSIFPKCSAI